MWQLYWNLQNVLSQDIISISTTIFRRTRILRNSKQRQINVACTIRTNRFKSPPFLSDKEIKKEGRGFSEELVNAEGDIVVVKWFENRAVSLASNFIGIEKTDKVKIWDKKQNKYIEVNRPEIEKMYNQSKGGVDLCDRLLGLYRIYIRS